MKTLFWGNLIFFTFFLLHLAAWKIKLPSRQTKTLLFIFFSGLAASLAAFRLFPRFALFGFTAPAWPAEALAVTLYVTSFILAYMITYSAVEADSPTLVMIKAIADSNEKGIEKNAFLAVLSDKVLVEPRLADLITDRMVVIDEGKYKLTAKGELFASIFSSYRRWLRLKKGG